MRLIRGRTLSANKYSSQAEGFIMVKTLQYIKEITQSTKLVRSNLEATVPLILKLKQDHKIYICSFQETRYPLYI
jgi:hypothetical protein